MARGRNIVTVDSVGQLDQPGIVVAGPAAYGFGANPPVTRSPSWSWRAWRAWRAWSLPSPLASSARPGEAKWAFAGSPPHRTSTRSACSAAESSPVGTPCNGGTIPLPRSARPPGPRSSQCSSRAAVKGQVRHPGGEHHQHLAEEGPGVSLLRFPRFAQNRQSRAVGGLMGPLGSSEPQTGPICPGLGPSRGFSTGLPDANPPICARGP